MNRKLYFIAAAFLFAAGATSCHKDNDKKKEQEVTLSSIAVTTPPNKMEYWAGEEFDPAGMMVTATYSDKTTAEVEITAEMLDYDFAAAGAKTVTITFEGKTAQITGITVAYGIRIVTVATSDVKMYLTGIGEAVINWGDGDEETVTLVNPINIYRELQDYDFPHTYAAAAFARTITVAGNITGFYLYKRATALNVSACPMLIYMECAVENMTTLDVSRNTALKYLECSNNQFTSIDVSNNTALELLSCFSNQFTSIDVSKNTALESLDCSSNLLTSLDVSNNTALLHLLCGRNQLTSLDVSNNIALLSLSCQFNQLTSLDLTGLPLTWSLNVQYNNMPHSSAVVGFTAWGGSYFFDPQRTPAVTITEFNVTGTFGNGEGYVNMTANVISAYPVTERGMEIEETFSGGADITPYPYSSAGSGSFTQEVNHGLQGSKMRARAYAVNQYGVGFSEWRDVIDL